MRFLTPSASIAKLMNTRLGGLPLTAVLNGFAAPCFVIMHNVAASVGFAALLVLSALMEGFLGISAGRLDTLEAERAAYYEMEPWELLQLSRGGRGSGRCRVVSAAW